MLGAVLSASYSLTLLTNAAAYAVGTIVVASLLQMGRRRQTEGSVLPHVTEAS